MDYFFLLSFLAGDFAGLTTKAFGGGEGKPAGSLTFHSRVGFFAEGFFFDILAALELGDGTSPLAFLFWATSSKISSSIASNSFSFSGLSAIQSPRSPMKSLRRGIMISRGGFLFFDPISSFFALMRSDWKVRQ